MSDTIPEEPAANQDPHNRPFYANQHYHSLYKNDIHQLLFENSEAELMDMPTNWILHLLTQTDILNQTSKTELVHKILRWRKKNSPPSANIQDSAAKKEIENLKTQIENLKISVEILEEQNHKEEDLFSFSRLPHQPVECIAIVKNQSADEIVRIPERNWINGLPPGCDSLIEAPTLFGLSEFYGKWCYEQKRFTRTVWKTLEYITKGKENGWWCTARRKLLQMAQVINDFKVPEYYNNLRLWVFGNLENEHQELHESDVDFCLKKWLLYKNLHGEDFPDSEIMKLIAEKSSDSLKDMILNFKHETFSEMLWHAHNRDDDPTDWCIPENDYW